MAFRPGVVRKSKTDAEVGFMFPLFLSKTALPKDQSFDPKIFSWLSQCKMKSAKA